MSNSGSADNAAGNKGSPSTPNPRRNDESPRRVAPDNAAQRGSPGSNPGSSSRPPRPSLGSSRSPMGGSGHGGYGQAVPVGGGSASGGARAPSNAGSPAGRKRGRFGDDGMAAGGSNLPVVDVRREHNFGCSVCDKTFGSPKALFGHMRSHPNRGWTGAHPPPVFSADEEFADIRAAAAPPAEEAPAPPEGNFRVPDLNNSPPPETP